ncbi:DNA/RNA helicase domain-containing protein [Methanobrevibacter sp. UBA417]|jgi:hypothetical protein|uniref:DNA/RNA helicase domain-containing protein n=1 Tax=Methanobrevibacter sp. UBA417 TaxID=1915487 RepID=UPI0039B8D47E
MLVFDSTVDGFLSAVLNDTISDDIKFAFKKSLHHGTSPNEERAWKNSMEYMYKILMDKNIPRDAGVAIEFKIPSSNKRIDFIVSGYDDGREDNVVIIELKQWESASKVVGKDDIVKTFVGGGLREVAHPSYQVWSYANLLNDFNQTVQDEGISLNPCAYLHNYKISLNDDIIDEVYLDTICKAPLYGKGDAVKLRDFISSHVKYGDNEEILFKINNSKIQPSKRLQDTLASMMKGNQNFVMIDEQKVAFETAEDLARQSYLDDEKRVLIVEGGPGTGKSVIAINLLVNLIKNDELTAFYVTKNSAPREVYYKELKGEYTQKYVKNLFKGSGNFYKAGKNEYDVLIVDEAHRLNRKSGLYSNQGENQIKEIINASKTSIFFIDEQQRIHIKDAGTKADIELYAQQAGAHIDYIKLESQFRCNGSDGYLSWLDDVLEIQKTVNSNDFGDYDYDFQVINTPTELYQKLNEKNKINNKSRLVAGYCWNWEKDYRDDTNTPDIKIGDFQKSWNLNNSSTWAIDPESFNEIGCVHTSQGLEFDYIGVILGKDIRYEDNKIITDFTQRAKTDRSLFGIKKMYKENPEKALTIADEIIKNTYRTLMTRGMKGCYIYCEDKKLQEYFKERVRMLKN